MKKNLLALSIAAMVGGIAGGANAQVMTDSTGGGRLISNAAKFGKLEVPGTLNADGNAVGAGRLAAANALQVNTDGIGHILFVPYFTTQGDNASLLNIVNTDQINGKAVKLRYRGASNSDDLFDITIYLSPGDVWTANVAADASGVSRLITDDKSCTLPSAADIAATGGKFKTDRVRAGAGTETREGYIEILNMADVPPAVQRNNVANPLFTATKHVNGVAPCSQAVMDLQEKALVAGDVENDPFTRGYSWPTGGLFANWTIVNVADKASFSGEAVAVEARVGGAKGAANLVWSPQTTEPVTQVQAGLLTADPLLAQGVVRAASFDFPDLSTPYTGAVTASAQAVVLANALEVKAVSNEFLTNQAVAFATDWVFSMPTRRYAVAMNYSNNSIVANAAVNTHFSFVPGTSNGNSFVKDGRICVSTTSLRAFDREENTKTTFVISPNNAVDLCGEVSVLSFNSADYSVLSASLTRQNIPTQFVDGWFRVATPGAIRNAAGQPTNGLPVIGFAAAKARGANLGGTWAHRYEK